MSNLLECEYYGTCLNAGTNKCMRCYDFNMLQIKNQKKARAVIDNFSNKNERSKENSWEDLEESVAQALNNVPDIQQARRSRRSGALWFEKGDIVDALVHPECKERSGNELKSGTKSMSIKKEWLDKSKEECKYNQKTMCLPFRFKEDETTYCIFEMNDIAELITICKAYMHDNDLKDAEIQALKEQLKKKQGYE